MSDDLAPADTITDFGQLYPRQQTIHTWTVLDLKGGEDNTAYTANTQQLTCDCKSAKFNGSGGEVCKHLSAALFQSSSQMDVGEAINHDLHQKVLDIERVVEALDTELEDVHKMLDAVETEAPETATAVSSSNDDGGDSNDSSASAETSSQASEERTELDMDLAVDQVSDWLSTGYAAPEMVEVMPDTHDHRDGVRLDPQSFDMSDGQKETFKSLVKTIDDSECHSGFLDDGCSNCGKSDGEYWWFIPIGAAAEVGE